MGKYCDGKIGLERDGVDWVVVDGGCEVGGVCSWAGWQWFTDL